MFAKQMFLISDQFPKPSREYKISKMLQSLSTTPVLILRSNNKSFKAKQRKFDRRIKNKKHLRQQIYSNHHNIFQSNIDLYRNKMAQNIIWDKNYNFKCMINKSKEQNSSLKAHIWNMEKENRRMERQIESWNIGEYVNLNPNKRPYIDMATVETVMADQDYQIVSMKMEIYDLEKELEGKEEEATKLTEKNKNVKNICRLLNNEIASKKIQIYECVKKREKYLRQEKYDLNREIVQKNVDLDMIGKKVELKRRTKKALLAELQLLENEISEHTGINEPQIETMTTETKRMRMEEDGGILLAKEKLRKVEEATKEYEYFMQEEMNKRIHAKIPLQLEIDQLLQILSNWSSDPKDSVVLG